jgi:hypothetical protein
MVDTTEELLVVSFKGDGVPPEGIGAELDTLVVLVVHSQVVRAALCCIR